VQIYPNKLVDLLRTSSLTSEQIDELGELLAQAEIPSGERHAHIFAFSVWKLKHLFGEEWRTATGPTAVDDSVQRHYRNQKELIEEEDPDQRAFLLREEQIRRSFRPEP
jgi:hypothetical protein